MDRQAFEQLALGEMDAVFRVALRLTRNRERAEDLVQDVYAKALRPSAVEGFRLPPAGSERGGMRAWLLAITHNTYYSKGQREARGPRAVGEFFDESSTERAPDAPAPAWDRKTLDWEHVDGRLKAAIENLREDYREVLLMWGVDGLKYREIAEVLGVPIGTVMSRLHRARQSVAEALLADGQAAAELGLSDQAQKRSAGTSGGASEEGG